MRLNSEVIKALPIRTVAGGRVIIEEGQKAGALFFLASGSVEVLKGETPVATETEPGAVFGEMSVLLDAETTATVRTRETCTFHVAEDARAFLRDHPELALFLATMLARRLQAVTQYLADVKHQFPEMAGHMGMVDDILDTLVHRQPRDVARLPDRGD